MKVLIHDAHNAAWRSMKRLPVLTSGGRPTQVIYGVLKLLRTSIDQFKPDIVVVCWDSGYSKFRKKIFPEYKANRNHERDEQSKLEHVSFLRQVKVLKKILPLLNIVQLEFEDTEADDLIAIVANNLQGEKTIISTDRDMLQLVSETTNVYAPLPTKPILYTQKTFQKLTGMKRQQFTEYRALCGDPGDNIPSIARGFGEGTAKDLILKYESYKRLWRKKSEIKKLGKRQSLVFSNEARKTFYKNLWLMDLHIVAAHNEKFEDILQHMSYSIHSRSKINRKRVKQIFLKYSFNSILAEFGSFITSFESLKR